MLIMPSWKNEQKKETSNCGLFFAAVFLAIQLQYFCRLNCALSHTLTVLYTCFKRNQTSAFQPSDTTSGFPYKMKMYEKEFFCFLVTVGDN